MLDAGWWVLVESVMASGPSGRWAWFMGRGRLLTQKNPSTLDIGSGASLSSLLPGSLLCLLSIDGTELTVLTVLPGAVVRVVVTLVGDTTTTTPLPSCVVDLASDLKV